MPFIGALSGTNLTNMRGDYTGRPFVCVTPATIKLQAQINITQTGKRASLTYANVVTGSHSNLKDGMLVIVHATQGDLYNYWWRGRVRGTASLGTIPINETDMGFYVNYYVTVIEDYDVFPRLARRANDTNYADYNLPFATLPPAIGGLQSSYVFYTINSTFSYSFTPTVTAMEKDATITTYLWDVADGTITSGTTATKDITVTFPAYAVGTESGHRWVSLTATDSNNVPHTFRFEVYVGDLDVAEFVLQDVDNISWSADWNNGYNAGITLHGDGSTLLPNQRLTIAYRDRYNTVSTPMNTSVAMVGRIKGDVISNSGVDWLKETRFTVEGFGTQLANLACPKFAVFDVDSPAEWNDIEDPTPVRAIWHTVTRYSTFATVCAFDFLSAYNNHVTGAIEIEAQGMLDGLNRVAGRIMAQVTFAPSGEWRIRQTASYLSQSTKDTLTTVASITTQDMLDFTIERQHAPRVGYVEGGASIYDPATKTYAAYIAKAPSIMNTSGEEVQQINGIILDSTSPSTASTALSTYVGSHLAREQNVYRLQVNFFDAWREIVPSNYDWYTFTIADDDNNRGVSIGTGRYYLLESVSWSADVATGTLTVNARFVQDVDAFIAGQDVARLPNLTTPYPGNPIQLPYGDTYLPDGVGTTYNPTDNPDQNENPIPSSALDPLNGAPEAGGTQPLGSEGVYYVPFTGAVVGCNFISVPSAVYTLNVSGVSGIGASSPIAYDYFNGNGDWNNYTLTMPYGDAPYAFTPAYDAINDLIYGASTRTSVDSIGYAPTSGWVNSYNSSWGGSRWGDTNNLLDYMEIKRTFVSPIKVEDFSIEFSTQWNGAPTRQIRVQAYDNAANLLKEVIITGLPPTGVGWYQWVQGRLDQDGIYELRVALQNGDGANTFNSADSIGVIRWNAAAVGLRLLRDMQGGIVTAISASFAYNRTATSGALADTQQILFDGVPVATNTAVTAIGSGTFSMSWTGSQAVDQLEIKAQVRNTVSGSALTLSDGSYLRLTALAITYSDPATGQGDAFYYGFENDGQALPYTVGNGFTVDGQAIPTIPAYNPNHAYNGINWTGDGSQITFQFVGFPTAEPRYLTVRIRGQNAR